MLRAIARDLWAGCFCSAAPLSDLDITTLCLGADLGLPLPCDLEWPVIGVLVQRRLYLPEHLERHWRRTAQVYAVATTLLEGEAVRILTSEYEPAEHGPQYGHRAGLLAGYLLDAVTPTRELLTLSPADLAAHWGVPEQFAWPWQMGVRQMLDGRRHWQRARRRGGTPISYLDEAEVRRLRDEAGSYGG